MLYYLWLYKIMNQQYVYIYAFPLEPPKLLVFFKEFYWNIVDL